MKTPRVVLDWKKLFAVEQADRKQTERVIGRVGEKIGGKDCTRPAGAQR
jgi:hypothetical protein